VPKVCYSGPVMQRRRRIIVSSLVALMAAGSAAFGLVQQQSQPATPAPTQQPTQATTTSPAIDALAALPVKGRAPKTGYTRAQFSAGWDDLGHCDVRNYILARDMQNVQYRSDTDCTVLSGVLHDPYTAKTIQFTRGASSSSAVQIDHVVALSDAWQKGAQQISAQNRHLLANDPLNLLAVDGKANNDKSDGDAATWLPPNKDYRCQYVARQIAVKQKYVLWVTQAEHDAMTRILNGCPGQVLPVVSGP
jgi:hypothetical protein